jgi:signal transduction histidine kinase
VTQPSDDLTESLIELERAQIGHEIHDALLPLIFAASSGVTSAIDHLPDAADESRKKLAQVSTWLSDAMQTGRRLLTEIYPPELLGTLWVRAAKDSIGRLFDDSATKIQWKTDPGAEETTKQIALASYRIVIESVRNAVRHGKATEIQIDASRSADVMEVVIRDNGSGFDPEQISADRFGVRAMHGRARLADGTLRIDSQAGGPTTVTFQVTYAKKS